jgi:uncharacterized protein involved in response to NO
MISLHTLEKGSLLNSTWVLIWYLRNSRSATVPGLHLCGFLLTPPVSGFLPLDAGFTASCFLGALAFLPVLFVCLVRAMMLFATDRQCGVLMCLTLLMRVAVSFRPSRTVQEKFLSAVVRVDCAQGSRLYQGGVYIAIYSTIYS